MPQGQAQWKTLHFWLTVAAIIVGGLAYQTTVAIPAKYHQALLLAGTILGLFGYQMGARWIPPGASKSPEKTSLEGALVVPPTPPSP
jgi:hypothetical protein